jgi:hypothetical protein
VPTVHLAGNRVVIGDRVIQRCLICGDRLTDIPDLSCTAVPEGMPRQVATFEVGAWVKRDGNMLIVVGRTESPEFGKSEVPEHCCVDLIEW